MTDKDINEGNKLICLFMDLIECQKPYNGAFTTNHEITSNFNRFIHEQMQDESWYVYPEFNESWDWLMFVVDRICDEELTADFEICNSYINIVGAIEVDRPIIDIIIDHSGGDDKKRAVFEACVKFIKQIK